MAVVPRGELSESDGIGQRLEAADDEAFVAAVEELRDPGRRALHDRVGAAAGAVAEVDVGYSDEMRRRGVEADARVEPVKLDPGVEYRRPAEVPDVRPER